MKKELSKVQQYAIRAAKNEARQAQEEMQTLLNEIAVELGISLDNPGEQWNLSDDSQFLERKDIPVIPKKTIPKGKKGKN
ncbi:MAG: hypothetical protein JRJ57_12380 [Deltaproteobacteria bacterium]|nr:hypothetical protein [Deltaproteobacteria bacterium]